MDSQRLPHRDPPPHQAGPHSKQRHNVLQIQPALTRKNCSRQGSWEYHTDRTSGWKSASDLGAAPTSSDGGIERGDQKAAVKWGSGSGWDIAPLALSVRPSLLPQLPGAGADSGSGTGTPQTSVRTNSDSPNTTNPRTRRAG
jgi:hypothetical protein